MCCQSLDVCLLLFSQSRISAVIRIGSLNCWARASQGCDYCIRIMYVCLNTLDSMMSTCRCGWEWILYMCGGLLNGASLWSCFTDFMQTLVVASVFLCILSPFLYLCCLFSLGLSLENTILENVIFCFFRMLVEYSKYADWNG